MPTAKKLPSGQYNVLVFSHKDSRGKRVYKSFTAPTKAQAELLASEFKSGKKIVAPSIRIDKAISEYIKVKTAVLSPSTIRGYKGMESRYFDEIGHIKVSDIDNLTMQRFVSNLSNKVSSKTVRNVYGFLVSVILFYNPSASFNITLPPLVKKIKSAPSDEDIQLLFNSASDKMKVCIALAAFGSLRRGEISALKYKDITENTVFIHSDMVKNSDGKWIHKEHPKTNDSIRSVTLPEVVIKMLGEGKPEDYIISWTPDSITKRFIELRNKVGVDIRFHDLRHFYASIGAVLQIPSTFLKSWGGWGENSQIMSSVYQNKIVSMSDHYSNIMTDHFTKIITMQDEMQDEK